MEGTDGKINFPFGLLSLFPGGGEAGASDFGFGSQFTLSLWSYHDCTCHGAHWKPGSCTLLSREAERNVRLLLAGRAMGTVTRHSPGILSPYPRPGMERKKTFSVVPLGSRLRLDAVLDIPCGSMRSALCSYRGDSVTHRQGKRVTGP